MHNPCTINCKASNKGFFPQCGLGGSVSSLETSKLLISALSSRTSTVTGFLYVHGAVMDS